LLLIVVRHGEAVAKSSGVPDENRGLTEAGKIGIKNNLILAKEIAGPKLDLILSSPALRAVESAEIVKQLFGPTSFEVDYSLASESTPYELFESLTKYPTLNQVLLVSHQPLVSQLIAGLLDWNERRFAFSPGSIAIIQLRELALNSEGVLLSLIPPHG
jgi:phosphohistidine phosphatase